MKVSKKKLAEKVIERKKARRRRKIRRLLRKFIAACLAVVCMLSACVIFIARHRVVRVCVKGVKLLRKQLEKKAAS